MDVAAGDEPRGRRLSRAELSAALVSREGNEAESFVELFVLAGHDLSRSVSDPRHHGHSADVSLRAFHRARVSFG